MRWRSCAGAGLDLSRDDAERPQRAGRGVGRRALPGRARAAGAGTRAAHDAFAGDDRFVSDYLRAEHLARLPAERLRFLRRTSVLERMSAPLCDAVLEASGSASTLEDLARHNLFVVPLDRSLRWFRYHHLFRDALRAELERAEPEAGHGPAPARGRVAAENGMPELAIEHCDAAGDLDGMARLTAAYAFPFYRSGRAATVAGWFERFDDPELLDRYPAVAVIGTWMHTLRGRTDAANRWAASVAASTYEGPMPDGSASLRPWAALVRAVLCRGGVAQMRADAQEALDGLPPASVLRAPVALLRAAAAHLCGDADAEELLRASAEQCAATNALLRRRDRPCGARADRAWIAGTTRAPRRSWPAAQALVAHAPLVEYSPAALMMAARARLLQRQGRTADARDQLARAQVMRPLLTHVSSWLGVQVRLELRRRTRRWRTSRAPARCCRRPARRSPSGRASDGWRGSWRRSPNASPRSPRRATGGPRP